MKIKVFLLICVLIGVTSQQGCYNTTLQIYRTNEFGVIYSDMVTKAIFQYDRWKIGPTLASIDVKKNDYVWWPTDDTHLSVMKIKHYNVTDNKHHCCPFTIIGPDVFHGKKCAFEFCCGDGCCC